MNQVAEASNYQTVKLFLEQIDRAESAKNVIQQAQQALKNRDDAALLKMGFTNQHIADLKNRTNTGKTPPYFASTTTLDNVITRLRQELKKATSNSEQLNEDNDINSVSHSFIPTSMLGRTAHRIDYLCLPG